MRPTRHPAGQVKRIESSETILDTPTRLAAPAATDPRARLTVVPRRSRLRALGINSALVLVSLAIATCAAELATRAIVPQQLIVLRSDVWEPADTLGWRTIGNLATSINTGERTVSLFTDDQGFRTGKQGRPKGAKRVLVLGDSFMAALQVEYEHSVPGFLESRLPEHLGEPVEVWNAGVPGWEPSQYLLRAKAVLPSAPFDVVLISLYVGNDVVRRKVDAFERRAPALRHSLRFPRSLDLAELIDAVLYPINDFLEERSHLFVFAKKRAQTVMMKTGITAQYFPSEFLRSQANIPSWAATADICEEIASEARRHGARPIFFLIPAPFQVDSAEFHRFVRGFGIDTSAVDLEQPTARLRDELRERNLEVIDALPPLRRAHQAQGPQYGSVDDHLNQLGNRTVADALIPSLVRHLRTPRGELRRSAMRAGMPTTASFDVAMTAALAGSR